MIKVSIIVPIFNVEKFLEKCLQSIQRQTLKEIEVLCINDGSTDRSLEIINKFVEQDSRFKVFSKPNAGYGHSMNLGFENSMGEFIGIVESDDFVKPEMFEKMYTLAKVSDSDVVKADYSYYWSSPERIVPARSLKGHESSPIDISPSIWSAIYRRDFLERNQIKFLETPGASYQDTSFNFKVWFKEPRFSLIHEDLIYYRQDNMNSSVKSDSKVFFICEEFNEIERYLNGTKSNQFMKRKVLSYLWNYQRMGLAGKEEFFLELRKVSSSVIKDYDFFRLGLSFKHMAMVWMVAKHPNLFRSLVKIAGR